MMFRKNKKNELTALVNRVSKLENHHEKERIEKLEYIILQNRISELENNHQEEDNKKLEYTTLQNRISELEGHHHSILIFTFTAIGVISAFALQQQDAIIFFINFFTLLFSNIILIRLQYNKIIISTYIAARLEKEITGLRFETATLKELKYHVSGYSFTIVGIVTSIFYFSTRFNFDNVIYIQYFVLTDWLRVLLLSSVPILGTLCVFFTDCKLTDEKIKCLYQKFGEYWDITKKIEVLEEKVKSSDEVSKSL